MTISITSLQDQSTQKIFRKCEIRRRINNGYESSWVDVSSYVTAWPSINFTTDVIQPFVYQRGSANLSFRNDQKQFSSQNFAGSLFSGFRTRYKTQCRISTGLVDENDVQLPTSSIVFFGVFTDNIIDTELETNVTVNDITQVLSEFPASNIAPSVATYSIRSDEIIGTIRDYSIGSIPVLVSFLSSSIWNLSTTGRIYNIPTTTSLDGLSALDVITELARLENHVFYLDGSGNFRFTDRNAASTSNYVFRGSGQREINIAEINNYNEGIYKVYTKVSIQISGGSVVNTQEAFTVGDNSSSWLYGQRELNFTNNWANSNTAASIASDILSGFSTPKTEFEITTKYITQLNLKDRVTVRHFGQPGGSNALWDYSVWDQDLYSDEKGGIYIDGNFSIIGMTIDMANLKSTFHLRGV